MQLLAGSPTATFILRTARHHAAAAQVMPHIPRGSCPCIVRRACRAAERMRRLLLRAAIVSLAGHALAGRPASASVGHANHARTCIVVPPGMPHAALRHAVSSCSAESCLDSEPGLLGAFASSTGRCRGQRPQAVRRLHQPCGSTEGLGFVAARPPPFIWLPGVRSDWQCGLPSHAGGNATPCHGLLDVCVHTPCVTNIITGNLRDCAGTAIGCPKMQRQHCAAPASRSSSSR